MTYPIRNAGFALGCLYMTVLGFDNITYGFILQQCVTESVLGAIVGVSAIGQKFMPLKQAVYITDTSNPQVNFGVFQSFIIILINVSLDFGLRKKKCNGNAKIGQKL